MARTNVFQAIRFKHLYKRIPLVGPCGRRRQGAQSLPSILLGGAWGDSLGALLRTATRGFAWPVWRLLGHYCSLRGLAFSSTTPRRSNATFASPSAITDATVAAYHSDVMAVCPRSRGTRPLVWLIVRPMPSVTTRAQAALDKSDRMWGRHKPSE